MHLLVPAAIYTTTSTRLLLDHGADILKIHQNYFSSIFLAILLSGRCAFQTFISNCVGAEPSSLLHFTTQKCTRLENLRLLLEHDSKVGGANHIDTMPLIKLVSKPLVSNLEVVEVLLLECLPGGGAIYRYIQRHYKETTCRLCYPLVILPRD
ncbi:hypothetical protein BDD12DRAFT_315364 [Trichophaea hybrida]|nr:hypothetical protein BDD12DRAFT_315364 [Trichophaea hybrida]